MLVPLIAAVPHLLRAFQPVFNWSSSAIDTVLRAALFLVAVRSAVMLAERCGAIHANDAAMHSAPIAGNRTPRSTRSAQRRGAVHFAVAGLLLVLLLSTRVNSAAPTIDGARALWLALTALLPALTEELAFRGWLAECVSAALAAVVGDARVRAGVMIVVVSLTFAFAHGGTTWSAIGWPLVATRFVAGLVFGTLALGDRTLLAPMLAHAMYDAAVAHCW